MIAQRERNGSKGQKGKSTSIWERGTIARRFTFPQDGQQREHAGIAVNCVNVFLCRSDLRGGSRHTPENDEEKMKRVLPYRATRHHARERERERERE